MKHLAVSVLLACASLACASTKTSFIPPSADPARVIQHPQDVVTVAAEPEQASNKAWLGAAGASEYVLTGGREQFVGVWVDVPRAQKRPHVPMALMLTVDTSGSMAGEKIVRAREAAGVLVNKLHDGDILAIHSFDGGVHELMAPTVIDARTRAQALGTVAELIPEGATNMHDALDLAIRRAESAPDTHPVRRVVMISDGRATAGPTSTEGMAQLAENGSRSGVQVTALGVGIDYDETALNALAQRSSGRLYHLADASELSSIISGELALLDSTMATSAVLEVVPAPGVTLVGASGLSGWGANQTLRIPLGTLFSGQRREILVRYRLDTSEVEGNKAIVSARLSFNDPSDGGAPRIFEALVRGSLTNDPALVAEYQNPQVQSIIALQEAATLTMAARNDIDAGNFDSAQQALASAEQSLRDQAKQAKSKSEEKRMVTAAEGIARSRRAAGVAAAAPPAARAAKSRSASLDANDAAMDAMGF